MTTFKVKVFIFMSFKLISQCPLRHKKSLIEILRLCIKNYLLRNVKIIYGKNNLQKLITCLIAVVVNCGLCLEIESKCF